MQGGHFAQIDTTFADLVPGFEIYQGSTYHRMKTLNPAPKRCAICKQHANRPYRAILARTPGTNRAGRQKIYICATDYKSRTGRTLCSCTRT